MRFATIKWTIEGTANHMSGAAIEHAGGYVRHFDLGLPSDMRLFLGGSKGFLPQLPEVLRERSQPTVQRDAVQLKAPISDPRVLACTGLNYRKHAEESGAKVPREPVWFNKLPSAIIGPEQPIVIPPGTCKVDFEAELVLVIGKSGEYIPEDRALEYIFGCTCGHDVSARDWQLERDGGQWWIGKTAPTFAPIGPVIVTLDELGDIGNLPIRFRLNGETMQESNTADMIFPPAKLVSHLSEHIPLHPGDLIFTGTPGGIGHARKPPVYLKPGDVCEVDIGGIGVLRNPVTAAESATA